jgi:hypothetical protein
MNTVETAEPTLLFDWGQPRPRQWTVLGFIGASLLLHALCFYIFQIVYRPTLVLLPPPARVGLITSGSEEGRTLLRWAEAEDPALASATMRPPDSRARALPKLQHIPSYVSEEPHLQEPPPLVVDLRPPSPQPPGPVPAQHRQVAANTATAATSIVFSEELADLGQAELPSTKFSAASKEQPESIRFRVAVGARGEIRFCFPLNSSGDAALDEQARKYLTLARFPARSTIDNAQLVWGIATVQWGNDLAPPAAKPTTTSP